MSEHIQPTPDRHDAGPTPTGETPVPPEGHERTPGVAHESEVFDFWLIVWVGAGLAAFCLVVQIALWGLLGRYEKNNTAPPESVPSLAKEDADRPLGQRVENVPGPHLEGIEREKKRSRIAAAREQAEGKMKHYGWIDKQKEIVHVPIDKAMDDVLRTKELGSAKQGRDRKRAENAGRER